MKTTIYCPLCGENWDWTISHDPHERHGASICPPCADRLDCELLLEDSESWIHASEGIVNGVLMGAVLWALIGLVLAWAL